MPTVYSREYWLGRLVVIQLDYEDCNISRKTRDYEADRILDKINEIDKYKEKDVETKTED